MVVIQTNPQDGLLADNCLIRVSTFDKSSSMLDAIVEETFRLKTKTQIESGIKKLLGNIVSILEWVPIKEV